MNLTAMNDSNVISPIRPAPKFYHDDSFLAKKTSTPYTRKLPPRPPSKHVVSQSRFFHRPMPTKPKSISFREDSNDNLSWLYNEESNDLYFIQCYEVLQKLGAGSFGTVFKVKSKEDGCYYAVKIAREQFRGQSDRERKLQEVAKHETLPYHRNLIKFHKAWEERDILYIQTELCDRTLREELSKVSFFPEGVIWDYLADLLMAVEHLHKHNLLHLDIRAENIFLSSGVLKLGDFGLVLDLTKLENADGMEGDPKYLAKELMNGIYTTAADIYSLGVCALEMACDIALPSGGNTWQMLRHGEIPWHDLNPISQTLQQVIISMMHPDYTQRPSATELLAMPCLQPVARKRRIRTRAVGIWKSIKNAIYYIGHIVTISIIFKFFAKVRENLFPKKDSDDGSFESPPHHTSRYSNADLDHSFTDDDVFDNSYSRPTRSSLFSPKRNSTLISHYSTPNSKSHLRHSNAPSMFGKLASGNTSHGSTIYADCSDYDDSFRRLHQGSFTLDSSITGPKNLLNVFDSISDDSE